MYFPLSQEHFQQGHSCISEQICNLVTWVEKRTLNDNTVLLGLRGWLLDDSNNVNHVDSQNAGRGAISGGDGMLKLVRVTKHVSVF